MKKKPAKVAESAAPYVTHASAAIAAGTPSKTENGAEIQYATDAQVRATTGKLFRVHQELFHKLAQ